MSSALAMFCYAFKQSLPKSHVYGDLLPVSTLIYFSWFYSDFYLKID